MWIMVTRKIFHKLIGIALALAFILSACNTAATVAPAPVREASPQPVLPAATAIPVPTATDTPIPTLTSTPTVAVTATPTVPVVAQVIPNVNAYCRKGPGSNYDPLTTLVSGTAYPVVGRNDTNTWWMVQLFGGDTCWTGVQGTSLVGPVEKAPIVLAQPVLPSPGMFMGTYTCNPGTSTNTFNVILTWDSVAGATGYHIFRNGASLASVGATEGTYIDYNAPMNVNLVYELEALNAAGSTTPVYAVIPACH